MPLRSNCRCVPSPQSTIQRSPRCTTSAELSPRSMDGAEADVPRKTISNTNAILARPALLVLCHPAGVPAVQRQRQAEKVEVTPIDEPADQAALRRGHRVEPG